MVLLVEGWVDGWMGGGWEGETGFYYKTGGEGEGSKAGNQSHPLCLKFRQCK